MTTATTVVQWDLPEIPPAPDPLTASVAFTCVGETPILFDAMSEERILDIMRGAPAMRMTGVPADLSDAERRRWEREHRYQPLAAAGIPRHNERPGIPSEHLMRCLVEAGEWVSYRGRTMLTDATRPRGKQQGGSRVPVLIAIAEEFLTLPNDTWEIDLRRGMREKRPVWVARAKFPEWGFHATLRYDPEELRESTVRELIQIAGFRIGLGSFRMDPRKAYHGKRAVFGRFRIVE